MRYPAHRLFSVSANSVLCVVQTPATDPYGLTIRRGRSGMLRILFSLLHLCSFAATTALCFAEDHGFVPNAAPQIETAEGALLSSFRDSLVGSPFKPGALYQIDDDLPSAGLKHGIRLPFDVAADSFTATAVAIRQVAADSAEPGRAVGNVTVISSPMPVPQGNPAPAAEGREALPAGANSTAAEPPRVTSGSPRAEGSTNPATTPEISSGSPAAMNPPPPVTTPPVALSQLRLHRSRHPPQRNHRPCRRRQSVPMRMHR